MGECSIDYPRDLSEYMKREGGDGREKQYIHTLLSWG